VPQRPCSSWLYILRLLSVITSVMHSCQFSANRLSPQVASLTHKTPVVHFTKHHQQSSKESSILQQQLHNQQVCCDHQFTDCCSECESHTHPRSSPLSWTHRLCLTALHATPLHLAATHVRSTALNHIMHPHYSPLTRLAPRCQDCMSTISSWL
jgi:hypothetical protein